MDYDLWSIELLFTLERKSPSHILSPSTCPLCLTESEGAYLFLVLFFQVLPVEIGFHFSHSADVCDFLQDHCSNFGWYFFEASISVVMASVVKANFAEI